MHDATGIANKLCALARVLLSTSLGPTLCRGTLGPQGAWYPEAADEAPVALSNLVVQQVLRGDQVVTRGRFKITQAAGDAVDLAPIPEAFLRGAQLTEYWCSLVERGGEEKRNKDKPLRGPTSEEIGMLRGSVKQPLCHGLP